MDLWIILEIILKICRVWASLLILNFLEVHSFAYLSTLFQHFVPSEDQLRTLLRYYWNLAWYFDENWDWAEIKLKKSGQESFVVTLKMGKLVEISSGSSGNWIIFLLRKVLLVIEFNFWVSLNSFKICTLNIKLFNFSTFQLFPLNYP